jgi:hypothetical protein
MRTVNRRRERRNDRFVAAASIAAALHGSQIKYPTMAIWKRYGGVLEIFETFQAMKTQMGQTIKI